MNNFDHQENTQSGKGGSHDAILMLFENSNGTSQDSQQIISWISDNITPNKRSLEHILHCQKLVRRGKFTERGRINDQPSQSIDHTAIITSSSVQYKQWVLAQHLTRCDHENELSTIPLFAATNSLLFNDCKPVTRIAFTPIIPYPATEFDNSYTAMVNFQDIPSQKKVKYGPVWSDEGVCRIAKEIHLQQPEKFDNIFLGIEGFHLKKIVIACCAKYLEKSGIECSFGNCNIRNFSSQFCNEWKQINLRKERNVINC